MAARTEPQEDHFEEKGRRHRTSTSCDPCRSAKQKCTVLPNMMDYSSRTKSRKESTASAGATNLTCIRCHVRGIPCIFSRSGTVKIANDDSGFHNIAPAKKRLITTQGSPEIPFKVSQKNSEARMLSMRESSSTQRTRMGRKNSYANEVRMSNPAHRVKAKDRHHSLPSKGASSRSEYGLDADESGILQPAELVENVSSFSAELGNPELRLNHESVEGAIESESMNDDNLSLRSGHLSGSRMPSRTHRRDTWFPRLVAIFQSYSSFNTSWRQEARASADLGSDAERSKSDSTESLRDILDPCGEETLHKLQNRSLHLFVALEPCLPPLSDLHLSNDDDQLLIAVLLACTAHVHGDQYLEAQHFGQMVRYCVNRAEKSIPFGIRGLNDVIALRLMAQNAPLFFPDNASSIAALPAHIVFSVAAEALSHRKRSFPPMSHRYHAECIQMCTIALHDTIVILGEDTLQDSTAATRCFSCSNCLGEGALTDVERFILAKKRLCDADWDSFGRHKHGYEIPFSSDGTCGTSTQLLFLRLANVRVVHSHCQSFARLFASANDEKISGMGMEAISLEAEKAFKDIGYQLDEANDLIKLVLRKTTNATARFLMKFVEIELINVHYSAMSQLIKTMLRPFAIHLGTPQSSIQFFRALHFDQSMKEIMVTLGTARINIAKKMCHKLIAFERLARNHARSGDVLLKLSEIPLKARQIGAQSPADQLPSMTDATHQNARSVTFAEVSMLLHSCNGSLCVNLTSASKALCEWISGRWFAGHLPSEESEWSEWHNILSIIEQAASSFESFDPLLGSHFQAQINGSSVSHPICVTARILRRFASTLETWMEAAGDSVYSDLFRAVELKVTPPSQGSPKDSIHNSSLSIKSFAPEPNRPQGMQDSSNLNDAPEVHESQVMQDTIDAASYNEVSSSDPLEQAKPSSCHNSFRPYTADELFDILNTPIEDFFLCPT